MYSPDCTLDCIHLYLPNIQSAGIIMYMYMYMITLEMEHVHVHV